MLLESYRLEIFNNAREKHDTIKHEKQTAASKNSLVVYDCSRRMLHTQ